MRTRRVEDAIAAAPGIRKLTMSDLQAPLWHPEKRLYEATKGDGSESAYDEEAASNYANAAVKLRG